MYEIDAKLSDIAQEFRGVYTRYADDIWFSANKSEYCTEFQARLYEIVEQSKSPNLSINESKTRFYRKGEPRIVTGLVITKEGIVSAPRMKKRYVRSLIHKSSHTRLEIEELKFLKGYLAFLKDNDPDYTRRLFMKYGKTLTNLIVRG
jgi:RNA-directed DNA polymerase